MNESERSLVPVWAKELEPAGEYYFSGVVENIDNLLELHRRDTLCTSLCTFGTRTSVLKQLKSRNGEKAMNNDSRKIHRYNSRLLISFVI